MIFVFTFNVNTSYNTPHRETVRADGRIWYRDLDRGALLSTGSNPGGLINGGLINFFFLSFTASTAVVRFYC